MKKIFSINPIYKYLAKKGLLSTINIDFDTKCISFYISVDEYHQLEQINKELSNIIFEYEGDGFFLSFSRDCTNFHKLAGWIKIGIAED